MRVLYLTNAAHIGGGNRSLLVLWQAIRPIGVEPLAVVPTDGPMVEACRTAGVPVEVRPYVQPDITHPIRSVRETLAWRERLRALRVDLVHANDPTNARAVIVAARSLGIPVVAYVHFPPGTGFFRWCFRFLPRPEAFAYCSHSLWHDLEAEVTAACPSSLNIVVHNSIPLEEFPKADGPRPGGGRLRVGILANLIPLKGHRDFLAMAAALTQEGLDAEYVVVGGDVHGTGYGDELKGLAASLGIGDRVTFTGHVGNIPTIVAGMDVFVCASHVEPFGICVLEAMAGSKPVVATRVGGIPEIVVPGETGYLVEPHRPDQLADRIRELAGHPDLRVRLGTTGRRRVEDEFSAGRQAARTLDLYEQALAAHRKRAGTAT